MFCAQNTKNRFICSLVPGHLDLLELIVVQQSGICCTVLGPNGDKCQVRALHDILQDILDAGVAGDPLDVDAEMIKR